MFNKKFVYITLFVLISSLFSISPARAQEKGYRYWGYFQSPTGMKPWVSSMTGPTTNVPDGSVEGWVFTFSSDSIVDAQAPRTLPNFNRLCASTKAVNNKKRVGIVIDFGRASLRPQGETPPANIATCVVVNVNAIGFDIAQAVAKIRASASGFVCAFNAYPGKECGAEVPTPSTLIIKK